MLTSLLLFPGREMTKSFEKPIQKLAFRRKFEPQDPQLFARIDKVSPRTLPLQNRASYLASSRQRKGAANSGQTLASPTFPSFDGSAKIEPKTQPFPTFHFKVEHYLETDMKSREGYITRQRKGRKRNGGESERLSERPPRRAWHLFSLQMRQEG